MSETVNLVAQWTEHWTGNLKVSSSKPITIDFGVMSYSVGIVHATTKEPILLVKKKKEFRTATHVFISEP